MANFRAAFTLWHPLNVDYEGGVLASTARVAIQLTHRLGAIVASGMLLIAALASFRAGVSDTARRAAVLVGLALVLQLSIGVSMVLRGFPLWLAMTPMAPCAIEPLRASSALPFSQLLLWRSNSPQLPATGSIFRF